MTIEEKFELYCKEGCPDIDYLLGICGEHKESTLERCRTAFMFGAVSDDVFEIAVRHEKEKREQRKKQYEAKYNE